MSGRIELDSPRLARARQIIRRLQDAGHRAFLVGGVVRDLLMGRAPHDADVVTDAAPEQITELFPDSVQVGAFFGVVIVPSSDGNVDVATFRREGPYLDGRRPAYVEPATLEEDVARRDFTVNALLYDPTDRRVIDLVGGRVDLEARVIRTVGEPEGRFAEDRLRMLRAVRLAIELEFRIDRPTLAAIQRRASGISQVSGERVRAELLRLLVAPARGEGLDLLHESGLLVEILPEVAAMIGVEQPAEFHPEGDVFTHTKLALGYLRDPSAVLALGTLLHDVGKPSTFERAPDRIRFHRHDEVGAELAARICRRLRLSGEEMGRVVELVREHLRIAQLPMMRPAKVKRFLSRPDFPDHLELHRADCLASHADLSMWTWAQRAHADLSEDDIRPPRLITGEDLKALGYTPGPRFREILEAVTDAQLEGAVRTREDALAFVERGFPLSDHTGERKTGPPTGSVKE